MKVTLSDLIGLIAVISMGHDKRNVLVIEWSDS